MSDVLRKSALRAGRDPLRLSFLVALFLAVTGNASFWRALAAAAPEALALRLTAFAILTLLLGLLLSLFAVPRLWKPVVIGFVVLAAVCAHFMDTYGAVIDRTMVQNTIETDAGEVRDLLTPSLLLRVALLGVLPALWIARTRLAFGGFAYELRRRAAVALACAVLVTAAIAAQYKGFALVGREHSDLRLLINPTSPLYAAWRYGSRRVEPNVITSIATDAVRAAVPGRRPLLVVLVVGETARSANFSLAGYARETNPQLDQLPVITFPNVSACGTSTAVSVPCMFSPFGREAYSDRKAKSHESVLDVLKRVGIRVLWRDNNSGCKSTCDRVERHADRELWTSAYCTGELCFDEVLLAGLPEWIQAAPGDALVVLHQQGSHGPAYYRRSPAGFKKFLPECEGEAIERCSREEIVNAYDNTILYTDHVLAELIRLLEREAPERDVAMLYVSDHGESLGERGLYLHGLPFRLAPDEQTRVPLLLWLSEGFGASRGVERACLEQRSQEALSHDLLFHSVLGLFDVGTASYDPALDLLVPCRTARAQATSQSLATNGTSSSSARDWTASARAESHGPDARSEGSRGSQREAAAQ